MSTDSDELREIRSLLQQIAEQRAMDQLVADYERVEAMKAAEMARRQAEYDTMRAQGYYLSGNMGGWVKYPTED